LSDAAPEQQEEEVAPMEERGLAFALVHEIGKLRRSTIILDREHGSGGDRQGKRAKIDEQISRLEALSVPLRDAPRRRVVECWYQPIAEARLWRCRRHSAPSASSTPRRYRRDRLGRRVLEPTVGCGG
jgi:hypothetical protein